VHNKWGLLWELPRRFGSHTSQAWRSRVRCILASVAPPSPCGSTIDPAPNNLIVQRIFVTVAGYVADALE
jgi:hypothetical protein